MFEKLNILFTKKQLSKFYLILFASIFATFFELIGIGSIPVFAMLIVDVESLINNISSYISIDLINKIDRKTLQITGSILLVSIFIFKNLYLLLLIFFQGKLIKDLRSSTSNKLYHYYISMPYISHLNRNPSILIRNITADIGSAYVFIHAYINLIREGLILVAIFILLLSVDPLISFFSLFILGVPVLSFYTLYKKKLKSKGEKLQFFLGDQIKTVDQSLGAIKETKLFNKEYHFLSHFRKLIQNIESLSLFTYLISLTPRIFLEVVALFSVAMISVFLIFIGKTPEVILPLISLFAISAVRFIPALNVITAFF